MDTSARPPSTDDVSLRAVVANDLPIFVALLRDEDANYLAAFTASDPANRTAFTAHWNHRWRAGHPVGA